jgi:regulation of enolase protein 1 (concanavalin A-like superfamily)
VEIPPLPGDLRWLVDPVASSLDDGALRVTAGPRTDLFTDPGGRPARTDAPCLLGAVEGDFLFGARVTVEFRATFDAGVLLLRRGDEQSAKLCFEYSPEEVGTIVSVVTRIVSDDANSFAVEGETVWLRIARVGPSFAFHASTDGGRWDLIRHFALEGDSTEIGFLAQSPTGDGCTAAFDEIFFRPERLADLRSGA